jgi:hypothetical protein
VEFLGFITDVTALYRRTRVMCCPIQSGAGTRVKILEAASHRVPVVSKVLGAEGLDFVGESDIVLRNDAAGLAEACGALLSDDEQAGRIGGARDSACARNTTARQWSRGWARRWQAGEDDGRTLVLPTEMSRDVGARPLCRRMADLPTASPRIAMATARLS